MRASAREPAFAAVALVGAAGLVAGLLAVAAGFVATEGAGRSELGFAEAVLALEELGLAADGAAFAGLLEGFAAAVVAVAVDAALAWVAGFSLEAAVPLDAAAWEVACAGPWDEALAAFWAGEV